MIEIKKFKLIGLALKTKTTNENGQSSIDCGNLISAEPITPTLRYMAKKAKTGITLKLTFSFRLNETKLI